MIDQLLDQVENKGAESILGKSGLAGKLEKMRAQRMPAAELSHYLADKEDEGKHRNGSGRKTVLARGARMRLTIPHDRSGSFETKLVANHRRRMDGFDDHVIRKPTV